MSEGMLFHVSDAYSDKGDFAFTPGDLKKVEFNLQIPPALALNLSARTAVK